MTNKCSVRQIAIGAVLKQEDNVILNDRCTGKETFYKNIEA